MTSSRFSDTSLSARNLNKLFIGLIAILWISVTPIIFIVHRESKSELARSLADSARESLLVGDSRAAMVILGKAIPKWFDSVIVQKTNGVEIFEIPGDGKVTLPLTVPVWLNEGQTQFGYVVLKYACWDLIFNITVWLFISTGLVYLLFRRERARLLKEIAIRGQVIVL